MLEKEKEQVVEYGKKLITSGLTAGTGGNISVFNPEKQLMAISPSGIDYFETRPEDVVIMDLDGKIVEGNKKPSSEWSMHLIYYQKRGEEIRAVVHSHSTYSTVLAICGMDLPASDYQVAIAGGNNVRCAEYATFGTPELAEVSFVAMKDRYACFLANHGLLACGPSIEQTFAIAEEVERLAGLHYMACTLGKPMILDDQEMQLMIEKFKTYGQVSQKEA
ncbi:L-fuculose-phosphate aldolase [Enterococcus hulanensis]|uniref:L-fuculose-phosphate aldolase n=1 Tax=Enterococcus hulanensis TaxID=2559929 RepID=UPI00288D01C2|nr:L-fuculose-phosphate aldolase [Enterococcus hulanensis]MDT2659795.1 L-fuculose-phosphate aldolase [Enterococcus hulanensis]